MSQPGESDPSEQTLARWNDEGGAQDVHGIALPAGITTRVVREYLVGSYRYTDLALAIAERTRQDSLP